MNNRRLFFFASVVFSILVAACKREPPPEMTLEIAPSTIAPCALLSIDVHVVNTSQHDWSDYQLLLFGFGGTDEELPPLPPDHDYASIGNFITSISISLPAGQTYESDVPWWVLFDPSDENHNARVFLVLVSADNKVIADTSIPIEIVLPTITLNVFPTELPYDSTATITIQIDNPSEAGLACFLWLSYGAEGEDFTIIKMLSVVLGPNETSTQEIPWTVDYIQAYGENEVEATLLVPYDDPSPDEDEVAAMLLDPEHQSDLNLVTSIRVPISFSQP